MANSRRARWSAAIVLGIVTVLAGPLAAQSQGQGEQGASPAPTPPAPELANPSPNGEGWRRERRDDDLARGPGGRGYDRDDWRERGRGERWGLGNDDRRERGRRERWGGGGRGGDDERGGATMHPRMAGPGRLLMRVCSPDAGRRAGLLLDRLGQITRPSEAQRPLFERLAEALNKAAEIARAGCPAEPAVTPPGRLAAAEKRLEALLQAVRTVRPAMDEFYGSLSEEQKARLYMMAPGRPDFAGGWRGREDEGYGERRPDRWRGERFGDGDRRLERWRDEPGDGRGDRGPGYGRRDDRGYGGRDREDDNDAWPDTWRGRM